MFERLGAKAVLLAGAAAMVFFGVGLIGWAIAAALAPHVGTPGAYAIAGAILLLPPLFWAVVTDTAARPEPQQPSGMGDLTEIIVTTLARETPWIAVLGAGLVGVANLLRGRGRPKK